MNKKRTINELKNTTCNSCYYKSSLKHQVNWCINSELKPDSFSCNSFMLNDGDDAEKALIEMATMEMQVEIDRITLKMKKAKIWETRKES